jgi:acetyl esterase/lipase
MFGEGDAIRDEGLTTPEDIERIDNIAYGADRKWQIMDVYRPKEARGKLPVIVSVHGGGWVYGDKERYQFYCMSLAQRGFAVVNFTYRLAPEFQFPAPLEDTNLVFTWVLDHAQEYGFDSRYVFGVGDSAGGNLLGLYAGLCTNPEYAKNFSFRSPEGFAPTAIALNCGCYIIEMKDPEDLTAKLMQDYLPDKGSQKEIEQVNVLNHITPDFPPVFFMTATGDMLQEHAFMLAKKVWENKIPFIFRFYGDKDHELGHVFHCNIKLEAAAFCNDEECDFFRGFMNNA